VIGTVRSRSEAEILSEAGGTVTAVHTSLGASVPAGFVIASLENSTEAAAVLQAEGAYDAAVASRASVSPTDAAATARNAFVSEFSALDTAVTSDLDALFGSPTPYGPSVKLASTQTDRNQLSEERDALDTSLARWRADLPNVDSTDPVTLLDEAEPIAGQAQTLAEELARSANASGSGATADQLSAIASARTSINGVVSALASARAAWRSSSTGSTASVDAGVKAAQGTLALAKANYEKTIVRAPIAGTVNFLPIRVGDYVTNLEHVATVAQNGALEIVLYVSEDVRATLSAGTKVTVDGSQEGVVTEIAPALDPVTKQIEVHVALDSADTSLVNGQSVRVGLPVTGTASTTASGPLLLPLSSVKLSAGKQVVFTLGEDSRLIALPVEVGEVRGDKIEVTTAVPADTRIVEDARGLSEGEQVAVAP
jgi:multidrug efflux pump subunit AcrA (membrane-fusion protein)